MNTTPVKLTTPTAPQSNAPVFKDGLYIPSGLVQTGLPKERIAIIGAPGAGKTTSCLTFPNVTWLDFDNKLPANVSSVPFWNPDFCATLAKPLYAAAPANKRDAFRNWLNANYKHFTAEQTLILDSWTKLQRAFELQENLENDAITDDKKSGFTFWKNKLRFSSEVMEILKSCKARVVVTFHEKFERDSAGDLTGKLAPVMDGSYKDEILGDFTDVWRQHAHPYERGEDKRIKIENGKKVVKHGWYWQLLSDELVNTNTNPVLGEKIRKHNIFMVRADYNEILKIYNMS